MDLVSAENQIPIPVEEEIAGRFAEPETVPAAEQVVVGFEKVQAEGPHSGEQTA